MAEKHHSDLCPDCKTLVDAVRDKPLMSNEDILACLADFRDKQQEYFVCLSLDAGYRLLARRVVTIGLVDQALAHPREVFAGPLTDRAVSVIIAHNHPSGDPTPSKADINTTQQLVAAAQILGIRLSDHVIVAADTHYSFRQSHLI